MRLPRIAGDLYSVVHNTSNHHSHDLRLHFGIYAARCFGRHKTSPLVTDNPVHRGHTKYRYWIQGTQIVPGIKMSPYRVFNYRDTDFICIRGPPVPYYLLQSLSFAGFIAVEYYSHHVNLVHTLDRMILQSP